MKNKKKRESGTRLPVIEIGKYKGKQVAIFNGKIIADGKNLEEAIRKAREKKPFCDIGDITFFSMPKTLSV